jgi:hypothetical protein
VQIDVRREIGVATRFTVHLPVIPPDNGDCLLPRYPSAAVENPVAIH